MKTLQKLVRNRYLFLGDIFLIFCAYAVTIIMIYHLGSLVDVLSQSWSMFVLTVAIFTGFMGVFKCYRIYWVYASTREYIRVVAACLCAGLVMDVISVFYSKPGFFLKESLFTTVLSIGAIVAMRMGIRIMGKLVRKSLSKSRRLDPRDILIIGAGELGVTLARDISGNVDLNYHILGFVDDDPKKQNMMIYGHKVLGTTKDISKLVNWLKPAEMIIAMSSVSAADKKRIIELCSDQPCKLKILPGIADSLKNKKSVNFIREVDIEDLLARPAVQLDNSAIAADVTGQVVLVTGGGGSIGSELCRQIARFEPKKLVVLDIYENNVFDLENSLRDDFPDCDVDVVIASVRDKERLRQVFAEYRPHLVFHAAAHKHVPLMENNAMEAVKNNVFGTYHTACCADEFAVKRFVMISTDKAVNPTNVMGATKRVCEMIVQAMQTKSKTEFVAVRFGNVLNSNGSVLPRFRRQIRRGGPITVTHPDITRFFMTIPEAAQLVLQAVTYASGGEIFVLDMGEPVRIYDMAKNLIRLSGLKEGKDIKIEITGLRPGEKLYEELLMAEEGMTKTAHEKIYIGQPFFDSMEQLQEHLATLQAAIDTNDNEAVKDAVARVVPTYVRKTEEEQVQAAAVQG